MSARDPYRVLGVPPDATIAEVQRAHRSLARRLHPDLQDPKRRAAADRQMAEVNAAYDAVVSGRASGRMAIGPKTYTYPEQRRGGGAYFHRIQTGPGVQVNRPSFYTPCLDCGERILRQQRRCPYCGYDASRGGTSATVIHIALAVWTLLGLVNYRAEWWGDSIVYVRLAWILGYVVLFGALIAHHALQRRRALLRRERAGGAGAGRR